MEVALLVASGQSQGLDDRLRRVVRTLAVIPKGVSHGPQAHTYCPLMGLVYQ